jgi:hypothetical protein
VRDDVEDALLIEVETVVGRAYPVAVAIDQTHVEGQKPEEAVNVDQRL